MNAMTQAVQGKYNAFWVVLAPLLDERTRPARGRRPAADPARSGGLAMSD